MSTQTKDKGIAKILAKIFIDWANGTEDGRKTIDKFCSEWQKQVNNDANYVENSKKKK